METKAICTRFSEQTIYKLDWLCQTLGQKRSEVLANLITSSFDQLNDNEQLKALFGQVRELEKQMQNIADSISK